MRWSDIFGPANKPMIMPKNKSLVDIFEEDLPLLLSWPVLPSVSWPGYTLDLEDNVIGTK